ncbi:diguanylate cyclase [Pseudofrankia sp. BMG5.37]|uniref:GGDEF domain-containing protein n=1 Tax=Pseudofrankia sp. BMG5.37 TaxID=3050035 RepID=UPI002895B9CF|nr:diguanylate cyclase [Pseudofrankia sp. BMG5.37]MDT3441577.1 diguanylate cyclase [Pseudofrankia sp. BMG5.37]
MATVTEAAASHGERRGRGSTGGNGGLDRRRNRMGAVLRRAWAWSMASVFLRLGVVINAGMAMMARSPRRRRPAVPDPGVLGDGGWVVDTPPAGLPTVPAPPATGDGAPPLSRPPGKRPRPPAAAIVGESARRRPAGADGQREPRAAAVAPAGRRPPAARLATGHLSTGPGPRPARPGGTPRAMWPSWRAAAVGAAWAGLAASWLVDPLFRLTDVLTFGTLLALGALALTASRRLGVCSRDDLLEIWTLPVVLLLPPVYALVTHLPFCLLATGRPCAPGTHGAANRAAPAGAMVSPGSAEAPRPAQPEGTREGPPARAAAAPGAGGSEGRASRPAVVARGVARAGGRQIHGAAALGVAGAAASWLHGLLAPTGEPYTAHSLAGSPGRLAAVAATVLGYALVRRLLLGSPRPAVRRASLPGHRAYANAEAITGTGAGGEPGASRVPVQGGAVAPTGNEASGETWTADAIWPGWWRAPIPGSRTRVTGRWRGLCGPAKGAEIAELCSGVAVAALWAANPLLMLAVVPPVLLLASSLPPDELLAAARTDPKTRLANVTWWREVAEAELARTRRAGRPLSVLLVDIDHFKQVNDRHGHLFGDTVLVAVADALRAATRPWDLVGRFGGEEFVVLLTDVDLSTAAEVAERIRGQVAATRCPLDGPSPAAGLDGGDDDDRGTVSVTVSVGAAACEPPASLASALAAADAALYRAKAAGRNRVHLAASAAERPAAAAPAGEAGPPVQGGAPPVPPQATRAD